MFLLLGVVVIVVLIASITRAKPDGTRPVSNTRLMGAVRIVLVGIALLLLYLAVRGWLGA